MIPRFILTLRHHCAIVKASGYDVSVFIDKAGELMVSLDRPCVGRHVRLYPFQRVVSSTDVVKPFTYEGVEYLPVYVAYRNRLTLNHITLSPGGKVSLQVEESDESFLRGLVPNGSDYVKYMVDVALSKYLEYPMPILASSLRLTAGIEDVEALALKYAGSDYQVMGLKVFHRNGLSIGVKRLSPHRIDVAVMASIDFLDEFRSLIKELVLTSIIVHDIRLGRLGEIPMGMDVFYPVKTGGLTVDEASKYAVGHGLKG